MFLVSLSSLLAGLFFCDASSQYVPGRYDWYQGQGHWISPGHDGAVAYYRKHISLSWLPFRATIWLSSPDEFEVYVNGRRVGGSGFTSMYAAGAYDIGALLATGDNLVAVKVSRKTYWGPASLLAHAVVISGAGDELVVDSDESWLVREHEEFQGGHSIPWSSGSFHDPDWQKARLTAPESRNIERLPFPPELLGVFPAGSWIWSDLSADQSAAFQRSFVWDKGRVEQAWIGVSTPGDYVLDVNGVQIKASVTDESNTGSTESTSLTMDVFDIGPYIREGQNLASILVSHQPGQRPKLLVSGVVRSEAEAVMFSSDSDWGVVHSDSEKSVRITPAVVIGGIKDIRHIVETTRGETIANMLPQVRILSVEPSADTVMFMARSRIPWIAAFGVFTVIWITVYAGIARRVFRWSASVVEVQLSATQALAIALFAWAIFAQFDPRFNPRELFSISLFLMLQAVSLLPLLFFIGETLLGARYISSESMENGD